MLIFRWKRCSCKDPDPFHQVQPVSGSEPGHQLLSRHKTPQKSPGERIQDSIFPTLVTRLTGVSHLCHAEAGIVPAHGSRDGPGDLLRALPAQTIPDPLSKRKNERKLNCKKEKMRRREGKALQRGRVMGFILHTPVSAALE